MKRACILHWLVFYPFWYCPLRYCPLISVECKIRKKELVNCHMYTVTGTHKNAIIGYWYFLKRHWLYHTTSMNQAKLYLWLVFFLLFIIFLRWVVHGSQETRDVMGFYFWSWEVVGKPVMGIMGVFFCA